MAAKMSEYLKAELARGRDVVLVSGYARLPDAVASHAQYERIGVVLVADARSGEILAAEPTMLTELARDFFHALLSGHCAFADPAALISHVERQYQGGTGPALISALRKALASLATVRDKERT